jgi:hypothetical protein
MYDVALGSRGHSNAIANHIFLAITFYSLSLSCSAHALFSNGVLSEVVIKAMHIY